MNKKKRPNLWICRRRFFAHCEWNKFDGNEKKKKKRFSSGIEDAPGTLYNCNQCRNKEEVFTYLSQGFQSLQIVYIIRSTEHWTIISKKQKKKRKEVFRSKNAIVFGGFMWSLIHAWIFFSILFFVRIFFLFRSSTLLHSKSISLEAKRIVWLSGMLVWIVAVAEASAASSSTANQSATRSTTTRK